MDEFEKNLNEEVKEQADEQPVEQTAEQTDEQPGEKQGYRPAVEPIDGVSYYVPASDRKGGGDSLATVSMILGIISAASVLFCCCCGMWYITAGLGIGAIICGILAKKKGTEKKGKWLTGIICGSVGAAVALIYMAFDLIITLTGGGILYELLIPIYEAAGIDTSELRELIDSGASPEEIAEWIEEAAEQLETAGGEGAYYGAKRFITGFLRK